MQYITLFETAEGSLLSGLSATSLDSLPPGTVDTSTLAIPTAVSDLGISDWGEFVGSGLTQFYLYSELTPNDLVLRSIDYYYYTIPSSVLKFRFTAETYDVSGSELASLFVPSAYSGQEETPLILYAEADGSTYGGRTYSATQQLVIYEWPYPSTPTGFTTVQPVGSLPDYATWQFNGASWIASSFPISLNLSGAQAYLEANVKTQASSFIGNQLRTYNLPYLISAPSIGSLVPADSVQNGYATMTDYETAVDALVNPKLATIAAATAVEDLYSFDPNIVAP